jgi:hypothetical protein
LGQIAARGIYRERSDAQVKPGNEQEYFHINIVGLENMTVKQGPSRVASTPPSQALPDILRRRMLYQPKPFVSSNQAFPGPTIVTER